MEPSRRSRIGKGKFSFSKFCYTLMSHARQPFFLATADALLATSWRRHTRQDVTQKASRRSLAAEIDFNFRFRDRLSFISLLDAAAPSPSNSLSWSSLNFTILGGTVCGGGKKTKEIKKLGRRLPYIMHWHGAEFPCFGPSCSLSSGWKTYLVKQSPVLLRLRYMWHVGRQYIT